MSEFADRLRKYRPTNEWGDGVHHTMCDEAADEIERLELALEMAYCQIVGADSPHGLSCCDDYKDWLKTLVHNAI